MSEFIEEPTDDFGNKSEKYLQVVQSSALLNINKNALIDSSPVHISNCRHYNVRG